MASVIKITVETMLSSHFLWTFCGLSVEMLWRCCGNYHRMSKKRHFKGLLNIGHKPEKNRWILIFEEDKLLSRVPGNLVNCKSLIRLEEGYY